MKEPVCISREIGSDVTKHTWSQFCVFLEAVKDFLLPPHIRTVGQVLPVIGPGLADEASSNFSLTKTDPGGKGPFVRSIKALRACEFEYT